MSLSFSRALSRRAVMFMAVVVVGCARSGQTVPDYRNNLAQMRTAQIQIKGQTFTVWLALDETQRERGLMQVPSEELAAVEGVERGMLFVFPDEEYLSFWMYNTVAPLDIAFIDAQGRIVKTHTMAPLETRLYPSSEPAQYALEVQAGTFERLGITVGDQVEIPDSLLKDAR